MAKQCTGGLWDSLINQCIPVPDPPAAPVSTVAPCSAPPVASTSVWVFLVAVVSVSLLALLLWFLTFRTERRPDRGAVEAGRPAEVGRDQLAMAAAEGEPPAASTHENGAPRGSQGPMESTWREAARCDEGGGGGVHTCNGRKEHGVPVPATELGDAALVTTKTVQQAS